MKFRPLFSRVKLASAAIQSGATNDRRFCDNFEMFDGEIVVTFLMRQAEKNPALRQGILRMFGKTELHETSWYSTAAEFADQTEQDLVRLSMTFIAEANFCFERITLPAWKSAKDSGLKRFTVTRQGPATNKRCTDVIWAEDLDDARAQIGKWSASRTVSGKPYLSDDPNVVILIRDDQGTAHNLEGDSK